jgi:diguanylate cyclase (GGDEF)-like protein
VAWSEVPDFAVAVLLAFAFASVARRSQTPVSAMWLIGWLMIVLHFAAFVFLPAPGHWGILAEAIGLASLIWAGVLFHSAALPYRKESSSRWMMISLLATLTIYVGILIADLPSPWILNAAAGLVGLCPLAILAASISKIDHPMRWITAFTYGLLSFILSIFQHRPGNGGEIALNAVLFTVFFLCGLNFLYASRRVTTGTIIAIGGFFAWASVFVVAPLMRAFLPQVPIESEVWNLPKYLVAVGMILVVLEDQIEHNKHLALHDELTGLPNRRLFLDRLSNSIERARRAVIDLDRFKEVNDSFGHHVGDLLLQQVGSAFVGRVRRSDTVARTGGDEFSVILEEPTSRADAERVAKSLLHLLEEPLQLDEYSIQVGASVGIALYPEDAPNGESLCIAADMRMYSAKHKGRPDEEGSTSPFPGQLSMFDR